MIETDEIAPKPQIRRAKSEITRPSSVANAIQLLKAFSDDEAELGISALARKIGVAKSTAFRLVCTLEAEGLLEQNPVNQQYRLGIGLFGLGTLVRQRMDLSSEARHHLFRLREITGETLLLGVPSETDIMYIHSMESPQALRFQCSIGVRRPAHCTAVGRAIFAFASKELSDRLLARRMNQRTPRTVTDPALVRATLASVREQRYALEDEESEPGIRCIASPIYGADGLVVGAVGIAGPSQRVSIETLVTYAEPLLEAVEAISLRLGYRGRRHGENR